MPMKGFYSESTITWVRVDDASFGRVSYNQERNYCYSIVLIVVGWLALSAAFIYKKNGACSSGKGAAAIIEPKCYLREDDICKKFDRFHNT